MKRELTSETRLRFAPSPTGALHVGGARTALFNWLLARGCGGKLILRIEDTDAARSTEESVQVILKGLAWLGLDCDEGPFFQSRRRELYDATIRALIDAGRAYPCFCSTDELEARREKARAEGGAFVYDGRCRRLNPDEARARVEAGDACAIRFAACGAGDPACAPIEFDDLIGGPRRFEMDAIGDFIIRRADGSPVYQLTVVADDLDMGITHVIRGDDHLANTPKQIAIYQALGRPTPHFGHLPLIQGPDRSRLSKRHGSTNLIEFAREGFLPEAMVNFLALLGWSLDAETEIMSREELIRGFSLDRINRSAAIFDRAKLEWMNGVYLRAKPAGEVVRLAREHFISRGVPAERMPEPWFASIVALEIERSRTLEAMRANLDYFFADRIESYDEKGAKKHFLSSSATQPPPAVILSALATTLAENCGTVAPGCDFDPITLEPKLRELAEKLGISFGQLIHPLRLALTGRTASPGIFDDLTGLGRERALSRIEDARRWIREKESPPPRPDPATRS